MAGSKIQQLGLARAEGLCHRVLFRFLRACAFAYFCLQLLKEAFRPVCFVLGAAALKSRCYWRRRRDGPESDACCDSAASLQKKIQASWLLCSVQSATRWPMQMQHYGTERVVDAPKLYLTLYAEYHLLNTHTFILKLTPCICALVQMNCNFEYM